VQLIRRLLPMANLRICLHGCHDGALVGIGLWIYNDGALESSSAIMMLFDGVWTR